MPGETGALEKNACLMAVELGKVAVSARPLPALCDDELRIKVEHTMVSPGTELHHITGTHTKKTVFPSATGYISVGRVVGMGAKVEGFMPGARVLAQHGHAAHHNAKPNSVLPIPEGVENVDAAAAILLGVSIRGVRGGEVRIGDSVAVFGLGVIGAYALHLSKVAGAYPVIGVDPVPMRRDIAKQLGADFVFDPRACDAGAEIRRVTNNAGARVVMDATGTPQVMASLPDLTAEFGKLVVLGGVHGIVPMDLYTRFQKSNLTMVGCGSPYPGDYPFDDRGNRKALLEMIRAGMVRPRPALTHCVSWREGPELYRMLNEEKQKVMGVAFDWTK